MQDNLARMVFREVIRPPLWVLAFIYFLFLSLVIAIWAALDNRSALISWIAATLGIIAIAIRWRTEITVDEKAEDDARSRRKKDREKARKDLGHH